MRERRVTATRRRQLERDIARAVGRLLVEFCDETGRTPRAVDIDLERENPVERGRYLVSEVRAHFED